MHQELRGGVKELRCRTKEEACCQTEEENSEDERGNDMSVGKPAEVETSRWRAADGRMTATDGLVPRGTT